MKELTEQDRAARAEHLIDFAAMQWETPNTGVRVKQALRGNHRIRLVEFSENFVEPAWCRIGHVAYVVQGTLEIDFGGRIVKVNTGDGLHIPAVESSKHKARVPHGTATLFIVEEA